MNIKHIETNSIKKAINADANDPDWMYRSVLHGAFSGCSKTDKDVLGTRDNAEYTAQ